MKRLLAFLFLFSLPVFLQAQGFSYDPRSGLFPLTIRADTLLGATADSNLYSLYVPQNMRIVAMHALAKTSDTSYISVRKFGSEVTALDSVKLLNNTTSNMTVYSNTMTAVLTKGSTYRFQYVQSHTGGASSTTIIGLALTVWLQLIY